MFASFDPHRIQFLAIAGSVGLLLFILELIRRKRIRENHSLLWLFIGTVFLFFSIWRRGLEVLANLMGIAYPPTAFLLILVMALFVILIQFSIITSDLAEKNKKMAQEIGLLKEKLREMLEGK
ncbi:MAG: DUF2304 domain-containing protein [Candidatus Edwardsbacteria bacterium]|nr:DUF2304 domain-containing protein [Candidatus Edwardsbacteria bacterium]